jgi:anti-sigma factor RsiW
MTACREYVHLLGAAADGELETEKQLEVDSHVDECEACRERVLLGKATKASLKNVVRASAPDTLRARMAVAMKAELARGASREDAKRKTVAWRTIVPLATAAAFALAWGALSRPAKDGTVRAGFDDDLIADLVAEHSRPLPPEARDPQGVNQLGQYVGVPVHAGTLQQRHPGARLVGGRVLPVHQERAAMLQYEVPQQNGEVRRVSIFVFDPRRIQVNDSDLSARPVGTAQVRVGHQNGYSVAVMKSNDGVGYALASDMNEDETAELAVASGDQ